MSFQLNSIEQVRPRGSRVVIGKVESRIVTAAGIELADGDERNIFKVIAVGPKAKGLSAGDHVAMDIEAVRASMTTILVGGVEPKPYAIIDEEMLAAVILPESESGN